ncbi:hypothetical protein EIP91_006125 [Steccherinum ochraceum]|uniref:Transmembrane protein n=1 Tax=Steccherinum ochraceum TaxID=92696 RepID=A0A4R0RRI2_9APHY|nr:hypothetical protein EIP91_006125 [Steccherinum ochraceum]
MSNSITLYFAPREHPSLDVPFALRPFHAKDVWEKRLPAFVRKASRYYLPVFEWVWFIVFVAAMIGVPIGMYRVAWNLLPDDDKDTSDDEHWWRHDGFDRVWKARLISFASWFAVTLLCYIPIIIWKVHGKTVVNKMLKKWENEDRALNPNQDAPSWKLRTPGFLSTKIKLVIYYPAHPPPSSFHPGAMLPPYLVNGPMDPNAAYYYQPPLGGVTMPVSAPHYTSQFPAAEPAVYPAPPPTSVSGLPLFSDGDMKTDPYVPPLDPNADPEKQHFEDVKV